MMKNSRLAEGVSEIFLPGEIEFRLFEKNREGGIEVSPALENELLGLAVALGVVSEGAGFADLMHAANTPYK